MNRRHVVKTLRYYAFSVGFLVTVLWLSDYRYDWALLLAGIIFGQLAILLLKEDDQ